MLAENLDRLLLETIGYLIDRWYERDVGIVASCLVDGDNKVFATSTRDGQNWKHAERNAYEAFRKVYGEPSSDAVFVVTLSPCLKTLKYRGEPSCSQLMKELGVKRTHFGVLDDMHVNCPEDYAENALIATLTEDLRLADMCKKLMSMFAIYDSRINSDLLGIKLELGDQFFDEVLSLRLSESV